MTYHITDTTKIANVIMGKLLGHAKTKHELTTFLSANALDHPKEKLQLVVAWSKHAATSHRDATYLSSEQEEADTKMMLLTSDTKSTYL